MSSGRSHSDADLEALANHPIPPQFNDPGFTRQSWLCAGGHGAVDKPAPAPSSMGAGLPAMAVGQSIHPALTLRHREASSLLQMLLSPLLCGSWLASDGSGSVNTSGNDIASSRASSLLQGVGGMQINRLPQMPLPTCGSWLASDGGGSVNTSGADIAPSRGKLAPTVELRSCSTTSLYRPMLYLRGGDRHRRPSRSDHER